MKKAIGIVAFIVAAVFLYIFGKKNNWWKKSQSSDTQSSSSDDSSITNTSKNKDINSSVNEFGVDLSTLLPILYFGQKMYSTKDSKKAADWGEFFTGFLDDGKPVYSYYSNGTNYITTTPYQPNKSSAGVEINSRSFMLAVGSKTGNVYSRKDGITKEVAGVAGWYEDGTPVYWYMVNGQYGYYLTPYVARYNQFGVQIDNYFNHVNTNTGQVTTVYFIKQGVTRDPNTIGYDYEGNLLYEHWVNEGTPNEYSYVDYSI